MTSFTEMRNIGYIGVGTTPPNPPGYQPVYNYIYPYSHTQDMDSRVPGTTTGTNTVLLSYRGAWRFNYWSNNNPTNCNLQPTQSPVKTMSINVLDCAPAWWHLGVHPNLRTLHAPATIIYIHIPPMMWADLNSAATAAANDWNTALAGTGVSLQIVDYDCGAGGNCVQVQEGYTGSGCAALTPQPGGYAQDGTFTMSPTLALPNVAEKNWRLRPFANLRRTMAHEFGHLFGQNHSGCSKSDSVMPPLSGPSEAVCNTPDSSMAVSPTPNDTLPAASSTYGNQLQKWCNF